MTDTEQLLEEVIRGPEFMNVAFGRKDRKIMLSIIGGLTRNQITFFLDSSKKYDFYPKGFFDDIDNKDIDDFLREYYNVFCGLNQR